MILSNAEHILQGLGITEPQEIDLHAIAHHMGALVKVCSLDSCEARIIGFQNQAIIRVSSQIGPRRQRFSIGHELGHWVHHRGLPLLCFSEDIGNSRTEKFRRERIADDFAADLILPSYLLTPIARQYKSLSFKTVKEIGDIFDVSYTATAIRLVERRHSPAILICHNRRGRVWFKRSIDVPDCWFPRDDLDSESFAFNILFGNAQEQLVPRMIGADAWFNRYDAERYEVQESTIRISSEEILTLVSITDEEMLDNK